MTRNQRTAKSYRTSHAKLIAELGGKCQICNTDATLTIHHPRGRLYDPAKLSSHCRIARYKREAAAGLIEVLCNACNARRSDHHDF